EINATRFVLDGLSLVAFAAKVSEPSELRGRIFDMIMRLKKYGVTSLIVGEIPEDSKALSRFGFEEFIVDSVIVLHYLEYAAGGVPRSLVIRKMRRTDHGTDIYPFEITKQGIVVRKG
ncbi:MAG: ATPase domain-containing protein, partial [Candidatus Aenigmatarchaeota archaeon]